MSSQKVYPNSHEQFKEFEYSQNDDSKSKNKTKFTAYLMYCILVSVYGGIFQFGWNVSVFNIPVDKLYDFYNSTYFKRNGESLEETQMTLLWSITNGVVPLGGMFGGLFSGYMADKFGRKNAMLATNVFVCISGILCIISKFIPSYETLIVGRFFAGLVSGIFTGICTIYVTEIAPTSLRGFAGTMNPLALTSGILFANIFGLPEILGTENLWPVLVALTFVPMLISFGLFFAVESPKYLYINKNKKKEAREVLKKLRNDDQQVEEDIKELENECLEMLEQSSLIYKDLFVKKTLRRALIVTLFLQIAQQLIGADALIFYSTQIFENAEVGSFWANIGTIILGVLQVAMTLICMFTIEKAGRRVLLLIGTLGVSASCFSLSIFRIFNNDVGWFKYMTIVSAVGFTIFFNIGPGSVAFMISSELFESNARGKATSLATSLNWLCILIITVAYPFIEEAIDKYSFLIFGSDSLIFAIILYFILPETKNKTTNQIKQHFENSPICFKLFKSKKSIEKEQDYVHEMTVRF